MLLGLPITTTPEIDAARPLSVSQYQNMLTNPIYYGVMRFNGELHQGKHAPLVSKQLFDAAQEILACRSKPNVHGPVACLYRGMFRCGECGASITSEIQKGHEYLRCTKKLRPCSQRYVRIEEINSQIAAQIHRFAVPDALATWMVQQLHLESRYHTRARAETVDHLRSKLKSIDERLQRLLNLHIEQTISLEEYRSEKNLLIGQRRELDDQLIDFQTSGSSWLEPAIAFIQAAKSTVFEQSTQTLEQKRDFLKKAGSNLKIRDRTIELTPRGPWKTVVDSDGFCFVASAAPATRAAKSARADRNHFECPQLDKVRTFFKDKPSENPVSMSVQAFPIPLAA